MDGEAFREEPFAHACLEKRCAARDGWPGDGRQEGPEEVVGNAAIENHRKGA